jgi:hypothetical protein
VIGWESPEGLVQNAFNENAVSSSFANLSLLTTDKQLTERDNLQTYNKQPIQQKPTSKGFSLIPTHQFFSW